jgi:Putative DNA-binding domain
MSDLRAFQQQFAWALENAGSALATNPTWGRAIRVHRNTAIKAAQDALTDNYPVVRALVGQEAFAACAAGYAEANPPSDPRLCLYGEHFDAFLSDYLPYIELPWLAGVARLEWLRIEALFAADALPLDPSSITGQIGVDTRLELHPAVRTHTSDVPVASLWLAHQPSAAPDAIQQVEWRPEIALVTRPAGAVMVRVADPGTSAFLSACARGEPLLEAAVAADEAGGDVAQVFAGLIAAGAFLANQIGDLPTHGRRI